MKILLSAHCIVFITLFVYAALCFHQATAMGAGDGNTKWHSVFTRRKKKNNKHAALLNELKVQSDILQLLIDTKSDLNAVDGNGQTALRIAVRAKNHGMIQRLISAGANPNKVVGVQTRLIDMIADKGFTDTEACSIYDLLASSNQFRVEDGLTYNPIRDAQESGKEHLLVRFFRDGADPCLMTKDHPMKNDQEIQAAHRQWRTTASTELEKFLPHNSPSPQKNMRALPAIVMAYIFRENAAIWDKSR